MSSKYDQLAGRFTAHEYGDPDAYFGHRAELVARLGPPLAPGELVLDLACADGSFGPAVAARGLRYRGVDASERMVAAARARGVEADPGDLLAYRPPAPVAATTLFRSLHLVADRRAFFAHVGTFTERKLVFDASPRRYSLEELRAELRAAGFGRVATRPFLVPQHARLPRVAAAALRALEPTPLGRALVRRRFALLVAAWRE